LKSKRRVLARRCNGGWHEPLFGGLNLQERRIRHFTPTKSPCHCRISAK